MLVHHESIAVKHEMAHMLSMKWRVVIFAVVTVAALLTISLWPAEWLRYRPFSKAMNIGLTWWGPSLLLLIPVLLCWVSFASKDREGVLIYLSMALVLFGFFVLLMWYVNDFVQPWCGFWQGCIGNWSLQN